MEIAITVTSKINWRFRIMSTGFVKGERTGKNNNIISPKGTKTRQRGSTTEELSHSDIESGDIDTDSVVIEELGHSNKIRAKKEGEKPVKVDLDNITPTHKRRLETWFSESEIEEMSKKEEALTGKKREDIDSVWAGIREDVESHNERVRQRKAEKAKKELREFARDPKYKKSVKELSGEQFQELIQEANSDNTEETQEEELQQALEEIDEKWAKSEPDNSINTPSSEIEEMAKAEWSDRDDVFAEFSKDFADSDNDTEYISLAEGKRKVRTINEEMAQALLNHENEPVDLSVEIHTHDKETGFVEATVKE